MADTRTLGTRPIGAVGTVIPGFTKWRVERSQLSLMDVVRPQYVRQPIRLVAQYRCVIPVNSRPIEVYHGALACTRLSDQRVEPLFYSTEEYPFALVVRFMDHLKLGE